jgi:hypothetical protein
MKKLALIIIPLIFLFNTCALEIANVIGPGGGYVFYDKGNYDGGWRYIECSSYDIGQIKDANDDSILYAFDLCKSQSDDRFRHGWELPTEAQLKKMLECFSYGLTQFSPDYYYISVNSIDMLNPYDPTDPTTWEAVVLHKNFTSKANGEVEKVEDFTGNIRVRPIRRF